MTALRAAVPADADALAGLHVTTWRETYAGIATPEAMDQLDTARRLPWWQDTLAGRADRRALLAEDATGPTGFTSFGAPGYDELAGLGEVKHLYVARRAQGTGLGRTLLAAALAALKADGYRGAALVVVRQNDRARAFYARMGGTEGLAFTDPGPLWRSDNIVVSWTF